MFTEKDEKKGLVKTYWKNVRQRVAKVDPIFAKIVDEINPDNKFPIYLAYYPYGEVIADTRHVFFPKLTNGTFTLGVTSGEKELIKHLGYGMHSTPMGIVLEKQIEFFIDLQEEGITIPRTICKPGYIFPLARILNKSANHIYAPNGMLTITSGARSVFMLPNIGCVTNHVNLQRDFNIQKAPAKNLYEHWELFKEITQSKVVNCNWYSCVLYFSENWINKLLRDKSWLKLKLYLHEQAWQFSEYKRNQTFYDIAFSVIQKKRNLKPNPYLTDTARHLFATALGAAPSYAPACSETALPVNLLQKIFIESYGLKKYIPTLMQPTLFNLDQKNDPVYYSLKLPSTYNFSPKSRNVSSTLFEMRELEHIMRIFVDELAKEKELCSDTVMYRVAKEVEFNYFHNEYDRHRIVKSSQVIANHDERFYFINEKIKVNGSQFASDAPFLRGCISMKSK